MAKVPLELELRLLLSWRNQARAHERKAGEHLKQGNRAAGFYAIQIKDPQNHIEAFRKRETRSIEALGVNLRKALARNDQLTHDAQGHGKELRKLSERIRGLQADLERYNVLLTTDDPQALGGEIILPLEDYPKRLESKSWLLGINPLSKTDQRTLAITLIFVVAIFVAISIFWNWTGALHFQAYPPTNNDTLLVRIHNGTQSPITLALPDTPTGTHTIRVDVLTSGGDDGTWILAQPQSTQWVYNGYPTTQLDPVQILQSLYCEFSLDLKQLMTTIPDAHAIKLTFIDAKDRELATQEHHLTQSITNDQ